MFNINNIGYGSGSGDGSGKGFLTIQEPLTQALMLASVTIL